jgi:hypothetical protein
VINGMEKTDDKITFFLLGFVLNSILIRLSGIKPMDDIAYPIVIFICCFVAIVIGEE